MTIANALDLKFTANEVLISTSATVLAGSSTLPTAVQNNITNLGTIASIGAPLGGAFGGTGINNGVSTFTMGGNVAFTGAFTFAGTLTGNTTVTFPTTGTLATTSGTISTITGTTLEIDVVTVGSAATISIDSGYLGQTSITTLGTITAGVWTGTNIALANGGTNASLTASNGGIFYSTGSAGAILSGTATATQMLQSGTSAAPSWSTTTWPATSTINQLLYSSAANVIGGVTVVNSAGLLTSAGGVPGWVAYTGTGAPVLASSPTLITPTLGAALATSIKFSATNFILDSNGNVLFAQNPQASAINYITFANGASGAAAQITFTGTGNFPANINSQGNAGINVEGTKLADNASTGSYGEVFASNVASGSPVSFSNATPKDLTSVTLTAGDWDVYGNINFTASGNNLTFAACWINTSSATEPNTSNISALNDTTAFLTTAAFTAPIMRVNVSSAQNVYISGQVNFATGTATASGNIFARRAR